MTVVVRHQGEEEEARAEEAGETQTPVERVDLFLRVTLGLMRMLHGIERNVKLTEYLWIYKDTETQSKLMAPCRVFNNFFLI